MRENKIPHRNSLFLCGKNQIPRSNSRFPCRKDQIPRSNSLFPCRKSQIPHSNSRFPCGKSQIPRRISLCPWQEQNPHAAAVALSMGQACHPRAQRASSRRDHHADAGSAKQLLWFDRTGTTEGVVGEPVTDALFFAKLSPDERRIAINQSVQGNMDLWLFDFGRGGKTRLTFDPSRNSTSLRQTGN